MADLLQPVVQDLTSLISLGDFQELWKRLGTGKSGVHFLPERASS